MIEDVPVVLDICAVVVLSLVATIVVVDLLSLVLVDTVVEVLPMPSDVVVVVGPFSELVIVTVVIVVAELWTVLDVL